MKQLTCLALIALFSLQLSAQQPSDEWYVGGVKLTDNSYRRGQVKYDLKRDIVQLRVDDLTETYSPRQLISFNVASFTDEDRKARQGLTPSKTFYSLPLINKNGYKQLHFFEVVVEGKATLLAREYEKNIIANNGQRVIKGRSVKGAVVSDPEELIESELAHHMYIGTLDGTIRKLPLKRKGVLALFNDHQSSLKEFIKQEELFLNKLPDMARLFRYYNSLED